MCISKESKLWMYEKMLTIRLFEEGTYRTYTHGWMPGLAHLYIGQEAVAVGVCVNLEEKDYILSTHRGHGHLIAKGGDLNKMMAEIMGKKNGYCKGKGGSMHITAPEVGILGANAIVGAGIPIATGVGLSIKLKNEKRVVVCFFGDGASNQGAFHEGINMASVWHLPIVYICENNLYGISVHQSRAQNIKNIATRAKSYGIPGKVVDGNDVLEVARISKDAIDKARSGEGPTLIECKTYRWGGHHVGDPGTAYRLKKEVQEWKEKCPIKRFRNFLMQEGILTEEEDKKIQDRIKKKVNEAIAFGRSSPYPSPEEALKDVFIDK